LNQNTEHKELGSVRPDDFILRRFVRNFD